MKKSTNWSIDAMNTIERFLDTTPPARLSRNLRIMYMEYLLYKGEFLPSNFYELTEDLNNLFHLLDVLPSKYDLDEESNESETT